METRSGHRGRSICSCVPNCVFQRSATCCRHESRQIDLDPIRLGGRVWHLRVLPLVQRCRKLYVGLRYNIVTILNGLHDFGRAELARTFVWVDSRAMPWLHDCPEEFNPFCRMNDADEFRMRFDDLERVDYANPASIRLRYVVAIPDRHYSAHPGGTKAKSPEHRTLPSSPAQLLILPLSTSQVSIAVR